MARTINPNDPLSVKPYTKQVEVGTKITPVMGGNFGSFTSNLITDYDYKPIYGIALDSGRTAGAVALNYGRLADASIRNMTGAAQAGIDSVNSQANSAYPYIEQGAQSFAGMQQGITGAYNAAGNVRSSAASITPYMDTFRGYGNSLFNQGNALLGQGGHITGQGQGILDMNAGMGGLGGEYVKWLQSINPDSFVSMAASDAQRSGQNAQGQIDRGLSRSGVDAGSARSAALKQQYAQALASAMAGAKTRARIQGKQMQGTALQGAVQTAGSLVGQGSQITGQGLQAQGLAGQMQQNAVQAGQTAGQLYGAAGNLQAQGAQLQGQQGAGYGNLAQTRNQSLGLTLQAQSNLTQAQQAAAQYYAQTSQGWGQVAGSGGIMSALFG